MPELCFAAAYQDGTDATAIYPGSGTPQGLHYVALGLVGECAEAVEALEAFTAAPLSTWRGGEPADAERAALVKEFGDVLWYLAQGNRCLGRTFTLGAGAGGETDPHLLLLTGLGGVAEQVKKAMRDDGGRVSPQRAGRVATYLDQVGAAVVDLADSVGVDLATAAAVNLAKLADRQARGVLSGSGDNR